MLKGSLATAMIKVVTMGFTLDREQAFNPNAMIAMLPALLGNWFFRWGCCSRWWRLPPLSATP